MDKTYTVVLTSKKLFVLQGYFPAQILQFFVRVLLDFQNFPRNYSSQLEDWIFLWAKKLMKKTMCCFCLHGIFLKETKNENIKILKLKNKYNKQSK